MTIHGSASLRRVLRGSDLQGARAIGRLEGSRSRQSANSPLHRVPGPFRVQQLPFPSLQGRSRKAGGGDRHGHHRVPHATGNLEVEQDRASALFVHLNELERKAPHDLLHRRRADRNNHHANRSSGPIRPRHLLLPDQREDHRRTAPSGIDHTSRLASRLELHNPAAMTAQLIAPRALSQMGV